jgi:thiol:disulfide interchange protein DsbD
MRTPSLPESVPRAPRAARAFVAAASALVGLTFLASHIGALAADLKLLPPEQAFRFAARALDTRTLEANFTIANGYYLYRDKMSFAVEPEGIALDATTLPPGKLKEDEFFGRVQTYRDRVVVRLSMTQPAPGQSITLRADSQGCADAGVCYPPHTQRITLAVPLVDGKPGPLVEAAPGRKTWFK